MTNTLTTLTIANPGFETGDMTGWTVSHPSVVAAVFGGDDAPRSGSYLATGGTVFETRMWQDFNVSTYAAHIDAGVVTLVGYAAWHAIYDPQPDGGNLEAYFLDGGGSQISGVSIWTHDLPAGWHRTELGTRAVPVGTRTVRLAVYNERFQGTNNDNYWDDFESPTLETTLPIGAVHDLDLTFSGAGSVRIAAPDDLSPGDPGAPVVIHNFGLALGADLLLRLGLEKSPKFGCAPPPAKAWPVATPVAASWICRPVTPPQTCEGAAANDDLDVVAGDRLVTLAGDGLKLVS